MPIRTGKNTHFDKIFQNHLVFWEIGGSTIVALQMHHEGGMVQKAPPATHLTVFLRVVELWKV